MNINNTTRYKLLLALTLGLTATNCKDDFNLPDQPLENYIKVYMPQAVNAPVVKTLKITDSSQSLIYGANLGGLDYATNDIAVNFSVDNSKVDSFNKANNTSYAPLPAGSYSLSATTAVIPKGRVSTEPLSITLKTKGSGAMEALKTYILPVSITGSKINVNEALRTAFFLVKAQPDLKDYPNYDRTGWQIIGFSSQEAVGEGANNGRAVFALDNNIATFWHSQWQNGSPGPPHYLTIDMSIQQTIHGLSFTGRQGDYNGRPNEVNVQVSTDNSVWTDAGTFNLQNSKDQQSVFLTNGFKTARYFKVTINSLYNATYTHLAELNAF
jgi:hypothetical protein